MTASLTTPSRHDAVTTPCPACGQPFVPAGRQRWCSQACRAAGYRRRTQTDTPAVTLPAARPRRPFTVYECDACGIRAVGAQYCQDCRAFMRRVGPGGQCIHCDEPLTLTELLSQDPQTAG